MTAPSVGRNVDQEKLVVTWLLAKVDQATTRVVTKLPEIVDGRVLRVGGVGGPDNGQNALLRVDVESFTPTRGDSSDDAWDLAWEVHDYMRALDGQTVNGQPVNRVLIASRPTFRAYSQSLDRVFASYDLDVPTYA